MLDKYQDQYALYFTDPSDRQLISSYLADYMALITSNQEIKVVVFFHHKIPQGKQA